ncbi:MAG: PRC-barrel domain-containing protein [Proteobacteria bacterium]|nr:PRC-barrel domain-containing protein [Pseudomonadota bacterium]
MGRAANVVKANEEIVGVNVINNADEDLGEISEVMLDKLTGQVAYVVLESGTFLGMGGKLFALPWQSLHYDDQKDCFRVDIDKDRLKNAPGFDKDHWPNMADKTWGLSIATYYKTKPYWERNI